MTGAASEPVGRPILIVVVLFAMTLEQSKTLAGLQQALVEDSSLLRDYVLLIWDNSPASLADATLPFPFHYHHAEHNAGVAGAYNGAARIANGHCAQWLLLLDQDTTVTADFLRGMRQHAEAALPDSRIAAVAPFLYAGDFVLSPRLWRFARHVPLPRSREPYIESRAIFAANSGTLMRLEALEAIGGFSPRFWLDHSDIYVFERFHQAGFRVRVASDLALQHEVAMLDYDARMTPPRYANYLAAEGDFLDLHRGFWERVVHLPRLAIRALRQRRFADPSFSRMTLRNLWHRLSVRRRQRVRERS